MSRLRLVRGFRLDEFEHRDVIEISADGVVNLTRSSRPSWPLSVERRTPYRRAKDFSAPNRRATDGRRIPPPLK